MDRSLTEKAKIVNRASLSSQLESTGSKLQNEPHILSGVCTESEITFSGKNWSNGTLEVLRKL